MSTARLRVLSLGAGVQSTALLMLVLDGEVQADAAIFADTGWEPSAVYDHLEQLQALAAMRGFPLHVVSNGNIRDTHSQAAFYDAPYYLRTPCPRCSGAGTTPARFVVDHRDAIQFADERYFEFEDARERWRVLRLVPAGRCIWCAGTGWTEGMSRRQCTHQLKIVPIRRKTRELLAERDLKPTPSVVDCLIGISLDEVQRMKPSDAKYIRNVWPLIERGWTRADCKSYLASLGIDAPRSACIGCPYHSDREWRMLRDDAPEEFADAVRFEQELQASGAALRGVPYLHRQRVPLDEVDLTTMEDHGQLVFGDECEGMCGV